MHNYMYVYIASHVSYTHVHDITIATHTYGEKLQLAQNSARRN